MTDHKILVSKVVHTPGGFLVFNAGEIKPVPDRFLEEFRAEGVIGEAGDAAEGDDLDGKMKQELRDVAAAEGVDVESDANKATLLEAIRRHRAAAEAPAD